MEHLTRMVKEMRTIYADELIKCVEESRKNNCHKNRNVYTNHKSEHDHFIHMICCQPTAFDTENIIKQLEEERDSSYEDYENYAEKHDMDVECDDLFCRGLDRAIEIVERGGRDENKMSNM